LKRFVRTQASLLLGHVHRWTGCVGLIYHRIGDANGTPFDDGLWSATAEDFDRQVRWLRSNFDVIVPGDIPDAMRCPKGRHVLITFDDGYRDNFTVAYPILRTHGVRATFYVVTGFIDSPRLPWWDEIAWMVRTSKGSEISVPTFLPSSVSYDEPHREHAVRELLHAFYRLPDERTGVYLDAIAEATGTGRYTGEVGRDMWMTWDMVREMAASGMSIGGHTVTHRVLSRMTADEQWREIAGCARRLEEELRMPMATFSYPVGLKDCFDVRTRDCLRRAQVQTAFSYYGGIRSFSHWDDFDIRRIGIERDTTFDEFRAMVLAPALMDH
jgi:peptidoglycan/xylan/chitin deacetylase (PgdA/CDA1 family)